MEYITPQKKTKKKTPSPMPRRNQKNKGQLENKEPNKKKAVKNGMYQQKPLRGRKINPNRRSL